MADARVGDTITHYSRKAEKSLPGYEEATPMVFCGLFPVDAEQYWSIACSRWFSSSIMYLYPSISLAPSNFIFFVARFPELRDALEKLQLNDAALKVWYMTSYMNGAILFFKFFGHKCILLLVWKLMLCSSSQALMWKIRIFIIF